jgi:hypothetical protein
MENNDFPAVDPFKIEVEPLWPDSPPPSQSQLATRLEHMGKLLQEKALLVSWMSHAIKTSPPPEEIEGQLEYLLYQLIQT